MTIRPNRVHCLSNQGTCCGHVPDWCNLSTCTACVDADLDFVSVLIMWVSLRWQLGNVFWSAPNLGCCRLRRVSASEAGPAEQASSCRMRAELSQHKQLEAQLR